MPIDNIDKILPFLNFESEDDFYYLQILQRKKENSQLGSNSRVIRNYYIKSTQYLLNRYDEIKKLCDVFNARAMIRLNKRSFEKVGFKAMTNLANTMMNREYSFLSKSYDRACGLGHNDSEKKWILDIDFKLKPEWLESMREQLNSYEPVGEKIIEIIPSKNGCHIISKPCDLRNFNQSIEVHKDNPTNLYIP
jgi:hypothetical protein